ncbi:hypothetical protein FRB99_008686 [Tulasnella sp. 403]|nr:hypothetical protein FRB99_008686 [Tulasnella sp. 403]
MSSPLSALVEQLIPDIYNVRTGWWLSAGATCLIFWDWLISLDVEVEYIWRARWSAGKMLYFTIRYPLLIIVNTTFDVTVKQCKVWIPADAIVTVLLVGLVQLTLSLRVYALYGKNTPLLILLGFLLGATIVTTITLYEFTSKHFFYQANLGIVTGCLPNCEKCFIWIPMIHLPILLFDTVIVAFTIVKCLRFYFREKSMVPALTVVGRDGLFYYLATFFMILFNVVFLLLTRASMATWWIPWMRGIVSIMGARLIVNLRGHIEEPREEDTGLFLHTVEGGGYSLSHIRRPSVTCDRTTEAEHTDITDLHDDIIDSWRKGPSPEVDEQPWTPSLLTPLGERVIMLEPTRPRVQSPARHHLRDTLHIPWTSRTRNSHGSP